MKIARAVIDDVGHVVDLFEQYRGFFGQRPDRTGAIAFLTERLANGESVLFFAYDEKGASMSAVGFAHLYPLFSSLTMEKVWVLNDLYVDRPARRQGIARQLIARTKEFAAQTGAKGVILETTPENILAQELYESLGFVRDSNYHYHCFLDGFRL